MTGNYSRQLIFLVMLAPALLWTYRVATEAHLTAPDPTAILLDSTGAFITQAGHVTDGRTEYGYWAVDPPPRVVAATLALEDQRFWWHPGVDPLALARAAWMRLSGQGRAGGASTLAMQVARMQHPRPRTLWAKAVEAGVALAITARYGRQAVLAHYLRLAPYGQGSHGIGHAAWWYFGRPAADLDVSQAALLAAVPQSPARLAPRTRNPRTAARATLALSRLGVPGVQTPDVVRQWRRPPCLALVLRLAAQSRALPVTAAPLLRATINLALQAELAASMDRQLQAWRNLGAQQAALIVVSRASNQVLAAVGSMPRDPGRALDFVSTPRSPGSTEKPFFYALALDRGVLRPDDIVQDTQDQAPGIANADHDFLGPVTPSQALANSRNVPAAALLRRLGLDQGFAYLATLGLRDADAPPAEDFGLGLAIGAAPTTLERLARAYAALADGGSFRPLRWLDVAPEPPPRPVMSEHAAHLVTRFLSDPMARLPTFPRYGSTEYPLPVACKTGTSQNYRDAWAIAWSDRLLVAAWVGRPDAAPMAQVSGARSAAQLVQSVLLRLHGLGRSDLVAGDLAPGAPASARADPAAPVLRILQPPSGSRVWRNPELPAALDRLSLRAAAPVGVRQVTWLVDGAPLATAAPDAPVSWPLSPGQHSIQLRLPLAPVTSAPVSITVE